MIQPRLFADSNPAELRQILEDNADEIQTGSYVKSLTENEVQCKKDALSDDFIEFARLKAELKAVQDEYKAKLAPLGIAMQENSEAIKTRSEEVNGTLYVYKDMEAKMVGYYDAQGLLVNSRRLRQDEMQITTMQVHRTGTGN
jgi:hypothetical protein